MDPTNVIAGFQNDCRTALSVILEIRVSSVTDLNRTCKVAGCA